VDAQIPPKHPLVVVGKRIEQFFGGKYFTLVGVYPKEGTVYTPEILEKVERITAALERLPGVRRGSVLSLMSSQLKDVQSGTEALDIEPLATKVPRTQAELWSFRERVRKNQFASSLLVNDDGSATAILLDFESFETAGGAERVYPTLEAIFAKERGNDVEIVAAGAPTLLYWLMQYTHRVALLFVLALVVIGYLHYRAFRTLQGMFIPLVTALLGVVWALGFMGLIRAPLDPWNVMTPILLLAIGAGHSVQILKRYYEEYARLDASEPGLDPIKRNRRAVAHSTTRVGTVMLIAGTIAALSFGSLATFGLPSIQSFGLCTAVGIVAALIVEMTFIPALRVLLPPPSSRQVAQEKQKEFFDPSSCCCQYSWSVFSRRSCPAGSARVRRRPCLLAGLRRGKVAAATSLVDRRGDPQMTGGPHCQFDGSDPS
jgi:predicted RND superfamily exporter protein